MKNSTVDIYMYIKGEDAMVVRGLVDEVVSISGVVCASVNSRISKLLNIEYDPRHTSSRVILDAVRQRGSAANLVGM